MENKQVLTWVTIDKQNDTYERQAHRIDYAVLDRDHYLLRIQTYVTGQPAGLTIELVRADSHLIFNK